jgi:hypothetical protein
MPVILCAVLAWLLLSFAFAAVLGRAVRIADEDAAPAAWTDEVDQFLLEHGRTTGG